MIYIKRLLICLGFFLGMIIYPFEMLLRYIATGEDGHEKTWIYKLIDKYA